MKHIHFILLIFMLVSSCKYPSDVVSSLEQSGENREELEKVLQKYRFNPRKHHAACFLIANMKYHRSHTYFNFDSSHVRFIKDLCAIYKQCPDCSDNQILQSQNKIRQIYDSLPSPQLRYFVSDLKHIKSDFLIDNIECAFNIYDRCHQRMPFQYFLEYVLPYRCSDETFNLKRSDLLQIINDLGLTVDKSSTQETLEAYISCVKVMRQLTDMIDTEYHRGVLDLFLPKFKNDCQNIGAWTTDILRFAGIPTIHEYTPQWQNKCKRHYWCASLDTTGVFRPYTPPDNNLMEDWATNLCHAGKVYAKTSGANNNTPYFIKSADECIPEEFSTPLLDDQTYRYHQCVTLKMPLKADTQNNVCYLCFFDKDEGLNAVGWGRIDAEKRMLIYENVPLNIMFFPAIFDGNEYTAISEPFVLTASDTIEWIPQPHTLIYNHKYSPPLVWIDDARNLRDKSGKQLYDIQLNEYKATGTKCDITVLKKYPDKDNLREIREQMPGTVVSGSNHLDGPYDTLYILNAAPQPFLQKIMFENNKRYRYYKLESKDFRRLNIAYLEMLGPFSKNHKCRTPSELPTFNPHLQNDVTSSFRIDGNLVWTGNSVPNAFDDDNLSYVSAARMILDYTEPVCLNGMLLLPRNADNMIVKGDSYTMLYYDGGWKEHSTIVADANYITFNDMRRGCVYWLRNNTRGREELPFIYNGNNQIFINTKNFIEWND